MPKQAHCGCRILRKDSALVVGPLWERDCWIAHCPRPSEATGAKLLNLAKEVVGFCVALREDHACWSNHQDAGVLFAKAEAALRRVEGQT